MAYAVSKRDKATLQLKENLLWYTSLRYLIIGLLLSVGIGVTLLLVGWEPVLGRFMVVGLAALILNGLLYCFCRQRANTLKTIQMLAFVQIFIDILLVSYVVYTESRVQTYAPILYAIPIFASGFLFGHILTIINAGLVSFVFSMLTIWDEYNYRPFDFGSNITPAPASYDFVVPIVFFSAAFLLMGLMAERVSEFKRQSEAAGAQEEMLSLATHQLRVPSTAVKGYLSLLHQAVGGKLDDKQLKHLELAIDENNQQLRLVDNLLKTALLDAGEVDMTLTILTLQSVLRRAVAEQHYFASYKNLDVKIVGDASVRLEANEEALSVIFNNLLHNALNYSPYGSAVTIRVSADESLVRVCIKDQGPGLTRDEKRRIFRRFGRVDKDDKVAGAGLGLYIAKMLTQKHGGYLEVQSKLKEGSEFCVTLPKKHKEKEAA